MNDKELLQKYNVPGPRYTSYPTVPFWKNIDIKPSQWVEVLEKRKAEAKLLQIVEKQKNFKANRKKLSKARNTYKRNQTRVWS